MHDDAMSGACSRAGRLGEPPIDAQSHHDGTRACYGHVSAAHSEYALAGPYGSFVGANLRVPRDVGEGAEAKKSCAACTWSVIGMLWVKRAHCIPTTRQGVQSSNWARSGFKASWNVGASTGRCDMIAR